MFWLKIWRQFLDKFPVLGHILTPIATTALCVKGVHSEKERAHKEAKEDREERILGAIEF